MLIMRSKSTEERSREPHNNQTMFIYTALNKDNSS